MKRRLRLHFMAALLAGPFVAPTAAAEPIGVQRFGVYVLADDVPRAELFYARLFGSGPQVRTDALIGFDVAGGLFALVSRRHYAPGAAAGGSVRPFLRVADIQATFDHVRRVAPERLESEAVVEEGTFRFFRLRDPEGNVIEFFSLAAR